jgi:hypothetical protein
LFSQHIRDFHQFSTCLFNCRARVQHLLLFRLAKISLVSCKLLDYRHVISRLKSPYTFILLLVRSYPKICPTYFCMLMLGIIGSITNLHAPGQPLSVVLVIRQ